MKYIRTKDGRILEWEKLNKITKLSIDTCEEEIKEADTIEELCDDFIVVKIDEEHKKENLIFGYWLTARINAVKGEDLYGAIWTDKGLIYVAKMNEKGALELL